MAGDKDDELQSPGDEVGNRIWPQNQNPQFYLGKVSSQRVERTGDINDTLNTVLNTLSRVLFVLPE